MMQRGLSLARAVWQLYDSKAGMETLYQDALSDLGLHYPPASSIGATAVSTPPARWP